MGKEITPRDGGMERFRDALDVLRKAASGRFEGSVGTVTENLMVLMGRGPGDSVAGALEELADRLEEAHDREVAAATGVGTCHIVMASPGWWECDGCGGSVDWDSCDPNDPPSCRHCPSCGAKVVSE